MLQTKNKIEISYAADADMIHSCDALDVAQYIKYNLSQELAKEIIDNYPVEVTLATPKLGHGYSNETHKMVLYIFSEQQMEEHDQAVRKAAYLNLAVDRALATLGETVCH